MAKSKGKITEKFSPAQIIEHKLNILNLLDACEAKTASSAARILGISPTKVRDWMKTDEEFRGQVKQALKVLADKLIEEIISDESLKMPQVVARIFVIKGISPEFRDSYKVVEFRDERGIQILEELRRLAEKAPKALAVPSEPEGTLLAGTIIRVNNAKQSTD